MLLFHLAVFAAAESWAAPDKSGPAARADADSFNGQVVSVIEGDLIVVLHDGVKTKVRLNGIDCPEHDQPFGREARQFTADQVLGKDVLVKGQRKDHFGRAVADVIMPDKRNLTHALVRAGLAWWYRKYSSDAVLAGLEAEARAAKRGLWAEPAIPPEQWRRGQRDLNLLK